MDKSTKQNGGAVESPPIPMSYWLAVERERDDLRAKNERLKATLESERKTEMWVTDAWIPKEREDELRAEIERLRAHNERLQMAVETAANVVRPLDPSLAESIRNLARE